MNEKGFCDACARAFLARVWGTMNRGMRSYCGCRLLCNRVGDPIAAALEGRPFRAVPGWIQGSSVTATSGHVGSSCFKDGDASASVLVRCSPFATPDHIGAVVSGWAPAPSFSLNVLKVMSSAA